MENSEINENSEISEDIISKLHDLKVLENKNKEYFDQQDPDEESIIVVDTKTNLRYQKLEQLYNQVVPIENYEAAKKKSRCEQARLKVKNQSTFTYGETTFRTIAYMFEVIRQKWGEDAIKPGDFFDLGSGHGNVCVQIAFIHPFKSITGIEILSPLHKMALQTKTRYDQNMSTFLKENPDLFPIHRDTIPEINYIKGSLFDYDWKNASVVFNTSTCFPDELIDQIYSKVQEMPSGSFHINQCNYMPEEYLNNWECVHPFSRLMSFGTAECLIYRKK